MEKALEVISVDDQADNLDLIERMSRGLEFKIHSFTDPIKALQFAEGNEVDLVFVDYMMPQMNGIELILKIRQKHPDIPIIMITAVASDSNLKIKAIEAGATEFLNKPLIKAEFIARITNLANLRKSQVFYKNWAQLLQEEVRKATEDIVSREYETLEVLGNAAEFKDPETANHIKRVALYSKMLMHMVGESEHQQNLIYHTSPLHDIGKLGIPDAILLKPGKLTSKEFDTIKTHTSIGFEMTKAASSPFLKAGAAIALTHHEKYNGGGYPRGLEGKSIPLFGRIVAITDVFDALTTKRPYKEPWPVDKALHLLQEEKGRHFDPDLVGSFIGNKAGIMAIYSKYRDDNK